MKQRRNRLFFPESVLRKAVTNNKGHMALETGPKMVWSSRFYLGALNASTLRDKKS